MKGQRETGTEPGRADAERAVSRETFRRLDAIAQLLVKWQKTINLVAPATLPELWRRHVGDSLQLVHHVSKNPLRWVDLGSGGGFPGLVVAAVLAERGGSAVHLVESDTRKAAFLREAARVADLPVTVHAVRIEQVAQQLAPGTHVVSARALAPLPKLLELAAPFLEAGAIGVFPKGRDAEQELTDARKGWTLDFNLRASASDPHGKILLVRGARRGSEASESLFGAGGLQKEPRASGEPPAVDASRTKAP
ncbi:16S rRNA (guanine(527)-N(7))-methyltransferase RsmG [Xanthobacter dioxanivorans]|uniref:Ribosomal RNA small subunit methyltransferase G n=1 Tax=Xanthobacter dioxanivorans TaxID=2528964 RepID=A0A974SL54_9HYPH|nr:16S rRNA (guanine(527)-N(7))-methyltransferase RsmG [Xanthobacter dioxanivorans]QRG08198.1 16S rRNA (guanine(527)-N(7))-methyltransferase RsmG [Xanthobacter dioxanivorans]